MSVQLAYIWIYLGRDTFVRYLGWGHKSEASTYGYAGQEEETREVAWGAHEWVRGGWGSRRWSPPKESWGRGEFNFWGLAGMRR